MIGVERRGRLGNQLFQFAFGIAASEHLHTSFVMADDTLRSFFSLGRYGRPASRARRALAYRTQRAIRPFPPVKIANTDFMSPAHVLARLGDRRDYAGFFQSEEFFHDVADRVRGAFTPLPRHRDSFDRRYADLAASPYICCHVRRTDYLEWLGGVALPSSYYRDALSMLDTGGLPVVFVGDDLSEVERAFGDMPGSRFERNDEIVDLQLLMHAEAVVSSNSSFGWWGAWLGRPGRTVIAPRFWLGFRNEREYPPAVVPRQWTQLAVHVDA